MIRYPDWQARLEASEAIHQKATFKWGEHDCLIRTGDAVKAMTGCDFVGSLRGKYESAEEARAILDDAGVTNVANYIRAYLPDLPEVKPAIMAQTGDIAAIVVGGPLRLALGIVMSSRIAVYDANGKPAAVPLTSAKYAFRVG